MKNSIWLYMLAGTAVALLLSMLTAQKRVLSAEELAMHDGRRVEGVRYLAILGEVFDVSDGAFYSDSGGYSFFVGRDGSRAFFTGNAEDAMNNKVVDLSPNGVKAVFDWLKFYREHETYRYVGKVAGRYFDEAGRPTAERLECEKILGLAKQDQEKALEFEKKYPNCNSRWTKDEGGEVWCVNDMVEDKTKRLVPRLTFNPVTQRKRCSCVNIDEAVQNKKLFEEYSQCHSKAQRCKSSE